jgi:hypothetical protein
MGLMRQQEEQGRASWLGVFVPRGLFQLAGTTVTANRAVDNYVYERVRNFLRRRHKVQSRTGTQFSGTQVFGKLGNPTNAKGRT